MRAQCRPVDEMTLPHRPILESLALDWPLRALGVRGPIKSPTYALMEPYDIDGLAVSHFDFYRFADPREWADAGLRDVFAAPGLKLVEWPDQAQGMLPPPDLRMELDVLDDDRRRVTLHALTPRGRSLLAAARR